MSLNALYNYAKSNDFSFDHEFINIHGWLVQFVEASHNDLWSEAVEYADIMNAGELKLPVIGREQLVAMWLFAGRAKDYQKIALFGEAKIVDETKLFDILKRYDLMTKWDKEKTRFICDEE